MDIDQKEKVLSGENKYTYPKNYFRIQVGFAKKVNDLGITNNFSEALFNYTSLYRRVTGAKFAKGEAVSPKWSNLVSEFEGENIDPFLVTEKMWKSYTEEPKSLYHPEEVVDNRTHFGAFVGKDGIDNESGEQKIELHYNDKYRGMIKDSFTREKINERKDDLKRMFTRIKNDMEKDENYRPKWVTMGSWINNFSVVKKCLPEDFVLTEKTLIPPDLSFKGDSLWGQFINSEGEINEERSGTFLNKVQEAKNLDELVAAFPVKVSYLRGPIEIFFREYGLN